VDDRLTAKNSGCQWLGREVANVPKLIFSRILEKVQRSVKSVGITGEYLKNWGSQGLGSIMTSY